VCLLGSHIIIIIYCSVVDVACLSFVALASVRCWLCCYVGLS